MDGLDANKESLDTAHKTYQDISIDRFAICRYEMVKIVSHGHIRSKLIRTSEPESCQRVVIH